MTTNRLGERMAAEANANVATWPSLTRTPGEIHKCLSGGYLVEVGGDAFPRWHPTRQLAEADAEVAVARAEGVAA
jgi:hypothetical protein